MFKSIKNSCKWPSSLRLVIVENIEEEPEEDTEEELPEKTLETNEPIFEEKSMKLVMKNQHQMKRYLQMRNQLSKINR
ncbi:hypothetical protein [Ureibacillus sinduriensis]|uniref:Uncharacterized protein n=2 Tax=Ureibacillus sinduriensis TaxID=561440 RepID=A0A0A3IH85_9BACL|nr:hypothetical protein [Ureibacillus sinduriensis]KGR74192.1 hypothetical protein CD33_19585 [Ureibacillus sinduriensis BLB-1 = JCM 15800]